MVQHSDQPECVPTLDQIADEFVARIRNGEHPSLAEYLELYPQYATDINELFPTLAALEKYDPVRESSRQPTSLSFEAPAKLGEYVIRREIGRGGMGVVYEAEHETMRRRVALKVLPKQINKPEAIRRFIREARAAGQLHHTNIVPVFEVGESDGVHFYAMQYIHGQNLDVVIDELKQFEREAAREKVDKAAEHAIQNSTIAHSLWSGIHPKADPALAPETDRTLPIDKRTEVIQKDSDANQIGLQTIETRHQDSGNSQWSQIGDRRDSYFRRVANVGVQIADALDYAHHHGVLHRDIKPPNLILDTDGVVWVTDFGLAKDRSEDLTHTGDIVGTLRYMAPERFEGHADPRSDVYSLGLTLYELCTLRYAYDQTDRAQLIRQVTTHEPAPPRKIRPEIPRDLETVIVKAIAREPERRYTTARQMAADLQRFLSDRPVLARRVTLVEKIYRWARRNPTRAALVSCLVLLCGLITGGSLYLAELNNRHSEALRNENARVVKAKRSTEKALKSAERANLSSRAHLYYAYLGEAEAKQASGNQGQNFDSLRAVQKAADVVTQLGLTPDRMERRHVALRTAAIAAMAHWDVDTVHRWRVESGWTSGVAVDFANQRVAQADRDGNIAFRRFGSDEIDFLLPTPGEEAWLPLISRNGKYLLVRHHNGLTQANPIVQLWDVDSRREVLRLKKIDLRTTHCFSEDSSMAAICRSSGTIEIYSTKTAALLYEIAPEKRPVKLAFARNDSQLIVTMVKAQTVDIWSVDKSPKIVERIPVDDEITALSWNENRKQMAAAIGREILVWPPNFAGPPQKLGGHRSRVVRLALHPSGKALMSSSWDGTTRLFNLISGKEVIRLEGRRLTFSGFDDDGVHIGFTSESDEFGVWRVPDKRPIKSMVSSDEPGARRKARFAPGHAGYLAYATPGGVEIWNHIDQSLIATIPSGNTNHLCFDSSGDTIFSSGAKGVLRWKINWPQLKKVAWGQPNGDLFGSPEVIVDRNSNEIDWSEDRQLLAVKTRSHQIQLIDVENGDSKKIGPHVNVSMARFVDQGRYLVTVTWQGFGVKVWDTESGELVTDLSPETATASVAANSLRRTITVVTGERRMKWSMGDWKKVSDIRRQDPDGWAGDAVASPDGKTMLLTRSRYFPQLIDAESGATLAVLEAPSRFTIGGLDWSGDGRYVSVADQESIQVWDIDQIRRRIEQLRIDWK